MTYLFQVSLQRCGVCVLTETTCATSICSRYCRAWKVFPPILVFINENVNEIFLNKYNSEENQQNDYLFLRAVAF